MMAGRDGDVSDVHADDEAHLLSDEVELVPLNDSADHESEAPVAVALTRNERFRTIGRRMLEVLKSQWFIFAMLATIVLAYFTPEFGRTGGPLRPEYTIAMGTVFIIFLVSGMTLRTSAIKEALLAIKLQVLSQVVIFGVTPLFSFIVGLLIVMVPGMPADIGVGFTVLGCLPTTVSSCSILTKLAHGNEAASVTISVIANSAGVLICPSLLFLYLGESGDIQLGKILLKLSLTVLLPMIIGQIIQYYAPGFVKLLKEKVNMADVNQVMLLLFLYTIFCDTFSEDLDLSWGYLTLIFVVAIALHIFYLALCWAVFSIPILRFTRADVACAMFCGAQKTLGVGMPLIAAMYGASAEHVAGVVAIPLLFTHPMQLVLGSAIAKRLGMWVLADPGPRPPAATNSGSRFARLASAPSFFGLLPGSAPAQRREAEIVDEEEEDGTLGHVDEAPFHAVAAVDDADAVERGMASR